MKLFKLSLVFFVFVSSSFIIVVNYLQNTNPSTFLGDFYPGPHIRPIKWFKINNILDFKSYGFSKPSSNNVLFVNFSKTDLKYNDSMIDIMTRTGNFIDDNLKEWKKSSLIFNNNKYKVQYKFHGSHNFILKQGKISLKIKSKNYINGAKKFSLITGFEEAFFVNVFLALQENKAMLISPDPGEIMLVKVNGKIEDYWFTQDLSDDYLKHRYGLNNYTIFEVSDNWSRNSGQHNSELDGFYYYLDKNNLVSDSSNYNKYRSFIKAIDNNNKDIFPNTDYKYMGRFLANLYFYYDAHHIQGDNNKYLYDYSADIVYPIARNEGAFEKIQNILNLDQGLFNTRKSLTTIFYKKAVCNDSIKYYRDLELYKLLKNRKRIISELDSLKKKYDDYHKYYNVGYMNIRYRYKKIRGVILHNCKMLMSYLNNGEVIIAYNKKNKSLKIATDYRVPLKIIDTKNSESFIFRGVDFKYENKEIKTEIIENEIIFKNIINKSQLMIVNMVTHDTLPKSNIIFNYF